MSTTLLAVRDLHVRFGESHVLQGIDLDVPEGGVTALLGRNGAGKTTTIKAVLGLVGRSGRIELGGRDIAHLPTHEIVRLGIGYVPEDREVFGELSVTENLRLAERDPEPDYATVHELFPDLKARAAQRAGTLSGGQQQMVALARALLNRNRLLLVDEPTKGLAPAVVSDVVAALERAAAEATMLLVEQNVAVAKRLAKRAIVLDQGRIAFSGDIDELLKEPAMARKYLGVHG
jgi:branched-chain amino acid transport system ATP-binding protein